MYVRWLNKNNFQKKKKEDKGRSLAKQPPTMEDLLLDALIICGGTFFLCVVTWALLWSFDWRTKCHPAVYPMHGGVQVC